MLQLHLDLRDVSPSLISPNPRVTYVLSLNLPLCCHISLSYIIVLDIKTIHQRNQTTPLHASHCHLVFLVWDIGGA